MAAARGEGAELFLLEALCGSDACAAVGGEFAFWGSCVRIDGCSVAYSKRMVNLGEQKMIF